MFFSIGPEWSHQKNYRSRHSEFSAGNYIFKRFNYLYYLSSRSQKNSRNQITFPGHDYKES